METGSKAGEIQNLGDPSLISILICDILAHFDDEMPEEWLYTVLVSQGEISFFAYSDALGFLLDNGSVETLEQEQTVYRLTDKGRQCARQLRKYVPKYYRDRFMRAAIRYVNRRKALKNLRFEYEESARGCLLKVECSDGGEEMLSLRIRTPSKESARQLEERILRNPTAVFGGILDLILHNEEAEIDLTDN